MNAPKPPQQPRLPGFPYPNTKVHDDDEISILSMLGGREAAKTSLRTKVVANARSQQAVLERPTTSKGPAQNTEGLICIQCLQASHGESEAAPS